MKQKQPAIFFSYRRKDSADITARIVERFTAHFDQDVIAQDVHSLQLGKDFRWQIEQIIQECRVVIVVIGDSWTKYFDRKARRYRDPDSDTVLFEIATALAIDITVIPLLVNDASIPKKKNLPLAIQDIVSFHAATVRGDRHFEADVRELIEQIEEAEPSLAFLSIRPFRTEKNAKLNFLYDGSLEGRCPTCRKDSTFLKGGFIQQISPLWKKFGGLRKKYKEKGVIATEIEGLSKLFSGAKRADVFVCEKCDTAYHICPKCLCPNDVSADLRECEFCTQLLE